MFYSGLARPLLALGCILAAAGFQVAQAQVADG